MGNHDVGQRSAQRSATVVKGLPNTAPDAAKLAGDVGVQSTPAATEPATGTTVPESKSTPPIATQPVVRANGTIAYQYDAMSRTMQWTYPDARFVAHVCRERFVAAGETECQYEQYLYGTKVKIDRATALTENAKTGVKPTMQDKYNRQAKVAQNLTDGIFNGSAGASLGSAGGVSAADLVQAIVVAMGLTPDAVRTYLKDKSAAVRAGLAKDASIAAEIAKIEALRAKPDVSGDVAALKALAKGAGAG